ncbi:calcium-binding protein, partial [Rhodobacteraceae bacterium]|nr:calcium-binding protein [Paracoccaceae bacterium]
LEGSVLTGDGSAVTDGDGIVSSSIAYQWLRDGSEVSGATSSNYTLTQADVGKSVAVKYSFRDESTALEEVVSAGSASVVNVNSVASGSVAISGKASEGSTLTADISGVVDEDGIDLSSVSYQWILNGSDIAGATSATYSLSGSTIGDSLSVRHSYTDNYGENESLISAAETVANLTRYPNTDASLADLQGVTLVDWEPLRDQGVDRARVLDPEGNLVEIMLPIFDNKYAEISSYITSETPRDDETVYTAELPGTGGVSSFTPHTYGYEFMVDNNGQNVALVYSAERFQADRDHCTGAGIIRFYDYGGAELSDEIVYSNQTDQGHRPSVYSINSDQYLILFQTNNPLDMPRLAPDVGYVVGRVINADTFEMEDTFIVAADTNLLVNAPQISISSDSQINISWNEYDLDDIFYGEHTTVYGGSLNEIIFGTNSGDYLYGLGGDDEIDGLGGDDVIDGGEGVDTIEGGAGDDIVDAGDGDDLIIGGNGAGDDYYKGGDGIDTVKYTSATDGITVNLTTGTATSTNGGDAAGIGTDTLVGIENIIGGNYSDILTGSSANNSIQGLIGLDFIDGVAGDDTITLMGNTTHDGKFAHNVGSTTQVATNIQISLVGKVKLETVIDGGADADTINLSSGNDAFFLHDSFSDFHSSLTLTTDTHTGAQSTQRIVNVETILGLGGDDIIDLTSPDYSLAGQVITINGGTGNDVIWGSDATETLIGGDGNDILFGGSGNDTLTGGSGADTFEFTITAGNDTITDYTKSDGDILKFYERVEYEGANVATISAGVVTFGSVAIDLGDTSLNSLDVLNVEYAII